MYNIQKQYQITIDTLHHKLIQINANESSINKPKLKSNPMPKLTPKFIDDEIIENMLIGNNISVSNLDNLNNGKIYIKIDSFAKIVNTITQLNTNYAELQKQILFLRDKINFLEINQQSFDNINAAITMLNIVRKQLNCM